MITIIYSIHKTFLPIDEYYVDRKSSTPLTSFRFLLTPIFYYFFKNDRIQFCWPLLPEVKFYYYYWLFGCRSYHSSCKLFSLLDANRFFSNKL